MSLEAETKCSDCRVKPGEFHEFGCEMEKCPFCGGQLITCSCRDKWIDTLSSELKTTFLDDESEEKWNSWISFLGANGRARFEILRSERPWKSGEASARQELLELLEATLRQAPTPAPNPDLQTYAPIVLKGFGAFNLRSYSGFTGRGRESGELVNVPGRCICSTKFEPSLSQTYESGLAHEVVVADSSLRTRSTKLVGACQSVIASLQSKQRRIELEGIGVFRVYVGHADFQLSPRVRFQQFADFKDRINGAVNWN